jgi:hypothetical protein
MDASQSIADDMGVAKGLCTLKPIVGDRFDAVPKGFEKKLLASCVFRNTHMNAVVKKLEESMEETSSPGIYIQGPMGAGKRIITYMISQYAKFHLQWLTVYIPNCARWTNCDGAVAAKGFFLDRVSEALSNSTVSDKGVKLCNVLKAKPDEVALWEDAAGTADEKALVEKTYRDVLSFLVHCTTVKVLLIFDEVNSLWSASKTYFDAVPWNMTSFKVPVLKNGDAEFIGQIPSGVDQKALYQVGELEPEEVETMMLTDLCAPLKRVRDFDRTCYDAVGAASGNIPRELGQFAARLDGISKRIDDTTEEPASNCPCRVGCLLRMVRCRMSSTNI